MKSDESTVLDGVEGFTLKGRNPNTPTFELGGGRFLTSLSDGWNREVGNDPGMCRDGKKFLHLGSDSRGNYTLTLSRRQDPVRLKV